MTDRAKDEAQQEEGAQHTEGSFGSGHPAEVVVNADESGSSQDSDKEE